ncbi:ABC transporter substrate-binding protein [Pigmentiphaga litoralis]|uniref:Sulfonate transport system substrate-binding protein n=1 Tax=Pigmentiphaga litoralis TaxID=516702 RepID=A0A7Y9LL70_9BURK|nr:ABC transporter substrate-binding protein [Pigmentiphaga litoralis]NYE22731.1 sulfonate transport system substrate-binding protein [Pigmentiphaga litoralis]NYE83654.1 sulfonate transport system substrate-binding protein [Pigmentiphaga litoralis]
MKLISAGVVAAGLVLLSGPLQASAKETPPKVIRLAGQGNAGGTPYGSAVIGVVRAQELLEKEFKAEGVTIEWQFPRGTGPAINEAIANGQVDFANYGGLPNIVGRGAGLPTKVVASYGSAPTYVLVGNASPIRTLADLKGKKVTVGRGTILELSLETVLTQAGLSQKDIQLFDLKAADQVTAITSGDVDAVVGGSNLLALPARGVGKIIYSTKGKVDPANTFGSFVVTEAFARKYPETTQRVVNAYVQGAHFASQEANRDALIKIWELTGTPSKAIVDDYAGDPLADRLSPLLDDFYVANVRRGIAFAEQQKLIRRKIDVAKWVDASYLNRAIATHGYQNVWVRRDAAGSPAANSGDGGANGKPQQ